MAWVGGPLTLTDDVCRHENPRVKPCKQLVIYLKSYSSIFLISECLEHVFSPKFGVKVCSKFWVYDASGGRNVSFIYCCKICTNKIYEFVLYY